MSDPTPDPPVKALLSGADQEKRLTPSIFGSSFSFGGNPNFGNALLPPAPKTQQSKLDSHKKQQVLPQPLNFFNHAQSISLFGNLGTQKKQTINDRSKEGNKESPTLGIFGKESKEPFSSIFGGDKKSLFSGGGISFGNNKKEQPIEGILGEKKFVNAKEHDENSSLQLGKLFGGSKTKTEGEKTSGNNFKEKKEEQRPASPIRNELSKPHQKYSLFDSDLQKNEKRENEEKEQKEQKEQKEENEEKEEKKKELKINSIQGQDNLNSNENKNSLTKKEKDEQTDNKVEEKEKISPSAEKSLFTSSLGNQKNQVKFPSLEKKQKDVFESNLGFHKSTSSIVEPKAKEKQGSKEKNKSSLFGQGLSMPSNHDKGAKVAESQKSLISPPVSASQNEKIFQLEDLEEILIFEERKVEGKEEKIYETLKVFLKVDLNEEGLLYENPKAFLEKEKINNQQENKFINDLTLTLRPLLQIHSSSFGAFRSCLESWLKSEGYYGKLFEEKKLHEKYENKFYRQARDCKILEWENSELSELLERFLEYIFFKLNRCISAFRKKIRDVYSIFYKTKTFSVLFEACCLISLRKPQTTNFELVNSIKQNNCYLTENMMRTIKSLSKASRIEKVTLGEMQKLLPIIDELKHEDMIKLSQKVILMTSNLLKIKTQAEKSFLVAMEETKSLGLLPFRVILSHINPKLKEVKQFPSEVFKYVEGPEWYGWLELYLRKNQERDTFMASVRDIPFIIKALSTMEINERSELLNTKESQVFKFIRNLYDENKKYFYEAICAIMSDERAVFSIEEKFRLTGTEIVLELRQLVSEIMSFPNCSIQEEDSLQFHAKAKYFLTNLKLLPCRAYEFEESLFEFSYSDDEPRCDRICHLVLDIVGYFSEEDIIIEAFEVIVKLLNEESSRKWMNLAMNINKPSLDFFQRSVSEKLVKAVNNLLTFILNSQEFYDSVRSTDKSFILAKAYPFRYQPAKYLQVIQDTNFSIPSYWFSNCLSMLMKQKYNPELLVSILSKLKIYPSPSNFTEMPVLLDSIVQACNDSPFWQDLMAAFDVEIRYTGTKRGFHNTLIVNQYSHSLVVFRSLKVLHTILELLQIKEMGEKKYLRHFTTSLLSNLRCLGLAERSFILNAHENFMDKNLQNPLVRLLTLVKYQEFLINDSALANGKWGLSSLSDLVSEASAKTSSIDFFVLRDPLVHPNNKFIDGKEGIAALALKVIQVILSRSPNANIEAIIFSSNPKFYLEQSDERYNLLKESIKEYFTMALESNDFSTSNNAWSLILTMRRSPENKKFGKEIFKSFSRHKKKSLLQLPSKIVSQFLIEEAQEGNFDSEGLLSELVQGANKLKFESLNEKLMQYRQANEVSMISQFSKIVEERSLVELIEQYDLVRKLCELVLLGIYKKYELIDKHCSNLVTLLTGKKLLGHLPRQIIEPDLSADLLEPRYYQGDILEKFVSDPSKSRQSLLVSQQKSVESWCNSKLLLLSKSLSSFLAVVLSINQTYYSNHRLSIRDRRHFDIFCQLHIPPPGFSAMQLLGGDPDTSLHNARACLDICIDKIEILKNYPINPETISCLTILDLLLNWLASQRFPQSSELRDYCLRILSSCHPWLGFVVQHEKAAKLLITIVSLCASHLPGEMESRIRETVYKTNSCLEVSRRVKQEVVCLLSLIPPEKHEVNEVEGVVQMWCDEENDQYFFNLSVVVLKLSEKYPVEIAKTMLFKKCKKLKEVEEDKWMRERYLEGNRKSQNICWIWALKIAQTLVEQGGKSTIVIHEISKFVTDFKKPILFVLNEARAVITENRKSQKDIIIEITYAQLNELEAVLEFLASLFMSRVWVALNRQPFEELLFTIMHRTILMFVESSMGSQLKKRYIPRSQNEKMLWDIYPHGGKDKRVMLSHQIDEEYVLSDQILSPSVFSFMMTLKFEACLKTLILCCTAGMHRSYFVREYFDKPIPSSLNEAPLKYSLTHWDHFNRAICELLDKQNRRIVEWSRWEQRRTMLELLTDVNNSAEIFTETGYLSSLMVFPVKEDELFLEVVECIGLILQMSACHIVCQVHFKNCRGSISKESIANFKEKVRRLSEMSRQKLLRSHVSVGEGAISFGRECLEEAHLAF